MKITQNGKMMLILESILYVVTKMIAVEEILNSAQT